MRLNFDNPDDSFAQIRGPVSHWTPESLTLEVIIKLLTQEVILAKGDHTKALHILPAWDKTRIGMIAYEEDIERKFNDISKFWSKLKPFERLLILEKMDLQYNDLPPHIQDRFATVRGEHGEAIDPLINYLLRLSLSIHGTNETLSEIKQLKNPLSEDPKLHSRLGSRRIDTDDAYNDLILAAELHLPKTQQNELNIATQAAIASYSGIQRKNGEDFVIHPIEITTLLIKAGVKDIDILIATLFHDLEDVSFCGYKPISKIWSDKLELYLVQILGISIPQRRLKKIARYISLVSKPELHEDGSELMPSQNAKKIMHERANALHATRIIKAGDYFHNCLTSDVVKKASLGNLIPRAANDIIPHLGIASNKDQTLTVEQRKLELRLKNLILRQRPELFKLYSEKQ